MGYMITAVVCWWSGAKVHSTTGTLSMEFVYMSNFCFVCGVLSMILGLQSWYMISTVSADGLVPKCIQPMAVAV